MLWLNKTKIYSMLKILNKLISALVLLTLCNNYAIAAKKLPIPRFVSIKSNEVNARKGPGTSYPIEWVYIKKGEPVEVIAEFEQWRKIRDIDGGKGWVHSSVISGRRSVIILDKNPINMHYRASNKSTIIAKIEYGVRCSIKKCDKIWCNLSCQDNTGWIKRQNLWGLYDHEIKIK